MEMVAPGTGGRIRRLVALTAVLVGLLVAPAAAQSPGSLTYEGCLGSLAACAATDPPGALGSARAVAVSPDGDHLYVAGTQSLAHFTLGAAGRPAFAGCLGPLVGCDPVDPAGALNNGGPQQSVALAISPDGGDLYVAAAHQVSRIGLDAAGGMTFEGCVGSLAGCDPVTPASALNMVTGVAVSADGGHVYTSARSGAVSHLSGDLAFQECVGSLGGCAGMTVASAVDQAYDLELAPGGRNLYVASYLGGNVTHLSVAPSGVLAYRGCIGARLGCAPTMPTSALGGAAGLAFNPAGTRLYVAAFDAGLVSALAIDAAGNPTLSGCVGDVANCPDTDPAGILNGAFRVAVSPDGLGLYAVSRLSDAVTHATLDGAGNPAFGSCNGAPAGCDAVAPATALDEAYGVAVSPDGADLYVAAAGASALSHFSITPQPPPPPPPFPPPPPPPPPPEPPEPTARIRGLSLSYEFKAFRRYTRFARLQIRGVPAGATVRASCAFKQRRCPGKARRVFNKRRGSRASVSLNARYAKVRLKAGTKITVRVTQPGWIGGARIIKIRASDEPQLLDRCLPVGSLQLRARC